MDIFLALRVIVSLGAVFGALWFGHRWITKGRPGLKFQPKAITVAARHGLGGKAGVAIVEADGRRYLLGVTEHAVTVLDRLDGLSAPAGQQTALTVVTATGPVPAVGATTHAETRVVSVVSTGPVAVGDQETRVVSVLRTGPVSTERLLSPDGLAAAAADASRTFEQQLTFAASFTDTITLPAAPSAGSLPEVFRIEPARREPVRARSRREDSTRRDEAREAPATSEVHHERTARAEAAAQPLTRRAAREAEAGKASARQPAASSPSASPLAGSILSPETWRQTAAALKRAR